MSNQKIVVIPDGKICDYIDGKFRNDTPEEYVRQTIEKRLINEHKYVPSQVKVEFTLQVGSRKPRADIVIWDVDVTEQSQGNAKIIIECKKETVDAGNAKDGIGQLQSYMSVCPNCEWGMWTNSKQKFVFRKMIDESGTIKFMEYNDIPSADGNLDDVNRPSRKSLKNASDDNLLFVFKTCHNHIYVNDGMQKQPAFFELLKVIFCKIEDERNIPAPLEFYTTSDERSNPDGQLTVQKRISKIFQKVKKRQGKIFDANDEIKLTPRNLLISRSGTIGNVTFVSKTLEKLLVSEHAIRIKCKEYPGYIYAFLKSKTGQLLVHSNIYGAVIQEIEPEHLATIPIPDAPVSIKKRINDLIVTSYELRDESNALIDEATALLVKELQFPDIHDFDVALYKKDADVDTFTIKLSDMAGRADASYHVPIVDAIVKHMERYAAEVTTISDNRISKDIILPGRFKRIYVEEGYGRVFIGGKQLLELDPTNKKYLSLLHHGERIANQLELHEGMTLITCSGTIGKVSLVGKHWENWTASQHIIRVVPANKDIAGYISVFLASDYGYPLITRYIYGSVVDEIDDTHVSNIPFPLLKDLNVQQRINELAIEANDKRYKAYQLEQQALQIIDEEVIFAK